MWVLPEVEVGVEGETVRLTDVAVHSDGGEDAAPCRLGLDILGALGGAVLDFRAGQLTLGGRR